METKDIIFELRTKNSLSQDELAEKNLCYPASGISLGNGGISKLKIPHQSHADFCSTDTAGGLDNRKGGMRPRGGGSIPPFLWGFQRGLAPHWHTICLQSVVCYTCWRG